VRRQSKIPDITFDLDGDGNVGGRDYVISKLFDKDGDGKLNAEERKAADEAVRNVSSFCLSYKFRELRINSFGMWNRQVPRDHLELCRSEAFLLMLRTSYL